MSIFRRIFNFEQARVEQLEKRLSQRYALGTDFPLLATLRHAGREHPATVVDMSSTGVSLAVAANAAPAAGLHVNLELALDRHRLELEARVAHQQAREGGQFVGLSLVFADFERQKTYLQLMQPVVIGQSLKPLPVEGIFQDDPRFLKQAYAGEGDNLLTIRLDQAQGTLHSFEFRMENYFCRGGAQPGRTESGAVEPGATGGPVFETSGGLHDEIHQLFRWVVPNLSAGVPENVREYLRRFAG